MPISLHDRDPELIARLDGSLERARKVAMLSPDGASKIGGAGLEAAAAREAAVEISMQARLERERELYDNFFETVNSPEIRREFQSDMHTITTFFYQAGVEIPTLEGFKKANIDIDYLVQSYWHAQVDRRAPRLVLTPYGFNLEEWRDMYSSQQQDPEFGFGVSHQNVDIVVDSELEEDFASYNGPPQESAVPKILDEQGGEWTLRVLPGTMDPTYMNVMYGGHDRSGAVRFIGKHPTLSEYLALQALNLKRTRQLIDYPDTDSGVEVATWLDAGRSIRRDEFEMALAPYGSWDATNGAVKLGYLKRNTATGVGIRPPSLS